MTVKCGFLDCNNPAEKVGNSCQSCRGREEWSICSACRQPEPNKGKFLTHHDSFLINKWIYYFSKGFRDKVPSQFQAEFDQILPDLKLSEAEKKIIDKAEKTVLDFLAEKGGKQDNDQWFNFCSVCRPELDSRMEDFANQHPEAKSLSKRIEETQEKLQEISKKIKQAIGKEKLDEIGKKVEEELEGEIGDDWKNGSTEPGNQGPGPGNDNNDQNRPNPSQNNDNSEKITQLQQEINGLKQEFTT